MVDAWALERKRQRALGEYKVAGRRGLEMGPLDRPIVHRGELEIYYLDHASTQELKVKYRGHDVNVDELCDIDVVADGVTPLIALLGDKAPLDYVVASHVIEHVPDMIGWLIEAFSVLKVGGRLILILPNKRFTFDVFRRDSAIEELLEAYRERRRRPGLRCVLDFFANAVRAETWHLWEKYDFVKDLQFYYGPDRLTEAQRDFEAGKYIDVHCWIFAPWWFMELMHRITLAVPSLRFDLVHFLTTQDHDLEFYVQLEKVETTTPDWVEMARRAESTALWPGKDQREAPTEPSVPPHTSWFKRIANRPGRGPAT